MVAMPFSSSSLSLLTFELVLFFIAYFTIYAAYYALFPDFTPANQRARSQGFSGFFKSIGMLLALAGGGFLMQIWKPLPFLLFTLLLFSMIWILYYAIKERMHTWGETEIRWKSELNLLKKNRQVRTWVIANTLWESAVAILRVFVVLYFTQGINLSLSGSSSALLMVGLAAIFAAPLSGYLADKYGYRLVMGLSIVLFAAGVLPPIFTTDKFFLSFIFPVAFFAVILMTLPFSMLMGYIPKDKFHGTAAGLFGLCQGLGALIGPILAGFAVDLLKNVDFLAFEKTKGYAAIYLVASILLLASLPFTLLLTRKESS
jgi:MFS family permease